MCCTASSIPQSDDYYSDQTLYQFCGACAVSRHCYTLGTDLYKQTGEVVASFDHKRPTLYRDPIQILIIFEKNEHIFFDVSILPNYDTYYVNRSI